jgi:CDP-diacylglycerol---glycerol-3-phosphate 3-phosphatidyltransferase
MTRSDAITASRLALASAFSALFLLPRFSASVQSFIVPALWIIAALAEFSDFLDGWTARRREEVSDFGKVFDPFADVILHLMAFACLAWERVLPLPFVLLVIVREQAVSLVRLLAARKGLVMGARRGGKAKTVSYVVVGAAALLRSSLSRLGLLPGLDAALGVAVIALSAASAVLSVLSFADYVAQYRKLGA